MESIRDAPSKDEPCLVHPFYLASAQPHLNEPTTCQRLDAVLDSFVKGVNSENTDKIQLTGDFHRSLVEWAGITSLDDLKEIVKYFERILNETSAHTNRAFYAFCQGQLLYMLYQKGKSTEILNSSITLLHEAVNSAGLRSALRSLSLRQLGSAYDNRFMNTHDIQDICQAICYKQSALNSVPAHPEKMIYFDNLSNSFWKKFNMTNSMEDCDRAVELQEQALSCLSESADPITKAKALCNLANVLARRCTSNGSVDDMEKAIEMATNAVNLTPAMHERRFQCLLALANALTLHVIHFGLTIEYSKQTVTAYEEALKIAPLKGDGRGKCLQLLAYALLVQHKLNASSDDLNLGIQYVTEAISVLPERHALLSDCFSTLSTGLNARFQLTNCRDDLNGAIEAGRKAIELIPNTMHDVQQSGIMNDFGLVLQARYLLTGSLEDLDEAIVFKQRAVMLALKNHPSEALFKSNLGNSLRERFCRTGSVEDLDNAVQILESAVQQTPFNCSERSMYLGTLSSALRARYSRRGDIADLNKAVQIKEEAVQYIPKNHADRSIYLNGAGKSYMARYQRLYSSEDLKKGLAYLEEAVENSSRGHCQYVYWITSLGEGLVLKYSTMDSSESLDRAIIIFEQALSLTDIKGLDYISIQDSLADALEKRFDKYGNFEDLERAFNNYITSLLATPENDRVRPQRMRNLGDTFRKRFQITKDINDLNQAIDLYEAAILATAEDDPDWALCSYALGGSLAARSELSSNLEDCHRALEVLIAGAEVLSAPPSTRFANAFSAGKAIYKLSEVELAVAAACFRRAVELLPLCVPRALTFRDRLRPLSYCGNIANIAADTALRAGLPPSDIVEMLELGRGVIASLYLDTRSDIKILDNQHPELAKRYWDLRNALDSQPNSLVSMHQDTVLDSHHRHALSNEFDIILTTIRGLPGFERFMLGPSSTEMMALAKEGPIVVFNIADCSSAFLVTREKISSLLLPDLKYSELEMRAKLAVGGMEDEMLASYDDRKSDMSDILEWLWDVAVGPVLEELGFTHTPGGNEEWPHVWWVPNNWLSILPIHAAGYHKKGSTKNVLDRVISSYIPTVRSLSYARERNVKLSDGEVDEILLVGMPTTPEQPDLPYVESELRNICEVIPKATSTVIKNPKKGDIIPLISRARVVHFACHGESVPGDPSQSFLSLDDWRSDPLTVTDIIALKLNCGLMYLSACHAATCHSENLLEEAIHIAGAYHLAGIPHVIATLWQIGDYYSADLAKLFYNGLLDSFGQIDFTRSAESLHKSVRHLRDQTRRIPGFVREADPDPLIWAPYIHMGP